MRRFARFLTEAWKGLVFVVTIRAIAKPYRSRRLNLAGR